MKPFTFTIYTKNLDILKFMTDGILVRQSRDKIENCPRGLSSESRDRIHFETPKTPKSRDRTRFEPPKTSKTHSKIENRSRGLSSESTEFRDKIENCPRGLSSESTEFRDKIENRSRGLSSESTESRDRIQNTESFACIHCNRSYDNDIDASICYVIDTNGKIEITKSNMRYVSRFINRYTDYTSLHYYKTKDEQTLFIGANNFVASVGDYVVFTNPGIEIERK